MYPAPWPDLLGFRAHNWVRHGGERSITEIAQRMADACAIRDGDCLIGCSLGGMVACEITKLRRIPQLFLVGSAVKKEEVNCFLSALHPLANYAPVEWLRISSGAIPAEFCQMFAGVDASFVRAMCAAVFEWEGGVCAGTRVHRIHGQDDLVIPPPARVDLLLRGGHLISMSHSAECAAYVGAHYVE